MYVFFSVVVAPIFVGIVLELFRRYLNRRDKK